jgi:hypothetical protein
MVRMKEQNNLRLPDRELTDWRAFVIKVERFLLFARQCR